MEETKKVLAFVLDKAILKKLNTGIDKAMEQRV